MSMVDKFSQLIFNIYEAFTVALFIKDKENLRCISSVTFSTGFDKNRLIPIEGTLPGWVVKHNEPLIISNFDKDENTLGYYTATEDIKSFMGYPMGTDGVVVVDSKKKWVFTDKEKKILSGFVSAITEEIERDKRFLETEERIDELKNERRVLSLFNNLISSRISIKDILNECLAISNADFCFIGFEYNGKTLIIDLAGIPEEDYLRKECAGNSCITSMVIEGGRELLLPYNSGFFREKPLFFSGEAIKARQFFGFPLTMEDVPFGVAGFVSISDSHLKEQSIAVLRDVSMFLSLYYSSLWAKKEYEKTKNIEPVTGALQFSAFLRLTEKRMNKNEKLSVLSIRLGGLNLCNRKRGIDYAEELLKRIFLIVRQCVGTGALITRKSGGHFYVLLGSSDRMEAKNILRILKHAIYKNISEDKVLNGENVVDAGLAYFPEDSSSLWEIIEKADRSRV